MTTRNERTGPVQPKALESALNLLVEALQHAQAWMEEIASMGKVTKVSDCGVVWCGHSMVLSYPTPSRILYPHLIFSIPLSTQPPTTSKVMKASKFRKEYQIVMSEISNALGAFPMANIGMTKDVQNVRKKERRMVVFNPGYAKRDERRTESPSLVGVLIFT